MTSRLKASLEQELLPRARLAGELSARSCLAIKQRHLIAAACTRSCRFLKQHHKTGRDQRIYFLRAVREPQRPWRPSARSAAIA